MKLSKIHIILHQAGINTKAYKNYVSFIQSKLDYNWRINHTDDYWKYWHMCKIENFDFTGEYEEAITIGHLTPAEAYNWVWEEFINK
jgi:hypothetical protein